MLKHMYALPPTPDLNTYGDEFSHIPVGLHYCGALILSYIYDLVLYNIFFLLCNIIYIQSNSYVRKHIRATKIKIK